MRKFQKNFTQFFDHRVEEHYFGEEFLCICGLVTLMEENHVNHMQLMQTRPYIEHMNEVITSMKQNDEISNDYEWIHNHFIKL